MASNSGNNGGQPPLGPGSVGFQPNRRQRVGLTRALQRMLHPHTTHGYLLNHHLRHNNWDVTAAYNSLVAAQAARQGAPAPVPSAPVPPPSVSATTPASGSNTPVSAPATTSGPKAARIMDYLPLQQQNTEQERRALVVVFRDQVLARAVDGGKLSISQAVLLLQLAEWDIGVALESWNGLEDALDRLHVNFDHMRSPEGTDLPRFKDERTRVERQDERLAILLNLTERPDWKAVQNFLRLDEVQFDLVKAVVLWFKSGIEKATKKKDLKELRKDSRSNRLPLPSDQDVQTKPADDKWAKEPGFFRRVKDFDPTKSDLIPYPPLAEDDREKRPLGFLIYPDRSTIQAGRYHVEDYFAVEYISKGKYWFGRFTKKACDKNDPDFAWPKLGQGNAPPSSGSDKDEQAKKVPFDFSNSRHVGKLNAWRRQQFSRATGTMQRKGSQAWQPMENALLWQQIKERFDKHAKAQQGLPTNQQTPFKLGRQGLQHITKLLNEAFVGTRPDKATAIRGLRTAASVGTQTRRFAPVVEDFGLAGDPGWFSKKRKGFASKDAYKAQQRKDLKSGLDAFKKWDAAKQRPAIKPADGSNKSGTCDYEDGVVSGDDERTKERKRAENRSLQKPIRESLEAAKIAREEGKDGDEDSEEDALPGDDEDDEDGDSGDEAGDGDDDDDDDDVIFVRAGTKRRRDD